MGHSRITVDGTTYEVDGKDISLINGVFYIDGKEVEPEPLPWWKWNTTLPTRRVVEFLGTFS